MPRFPDDDMHRLRQRYALVIEGQCPNGHGELERRTECGWCEQCGMGWSVRGQEVTAHFDVTDVRIDGMPSLVSGASRIRWTSTRFS